MKQPTPAPAVDSVIRRRKRAAPDHKFVLARLTRLVKELKAPAARSTADPAES